MSFIISFEQLKTSWQEATTMSRCAAQKMIDDAHQKRASQLKLIEIAHVSTTLFQEHLPKEYVNAVKIMRTIAGISNIFPVTQAEADPSLIILTKSEGRITYIIMRQLGTCLFAVFSRLTS